MKSAFEEFLKEQHAEDYHGTDDDMPDAYEKWFCELDIDYLIQLADLAIIKAETRGIKRGGDIALQALQNASLSSD
jgi:hypothetical protein